MIAFPLPMTPENWQLLRASIEHDDTLRRGWHHTPWLDWLTDHCDRQGGSWRHSFGVDSKMSACCWLYARLESVVIEPGREIAVYQSTKPVMMPAFPRAWLIAYATLLARVDGTPERKKTAERASGWYVDAYVDGDVRAYSVGDSNWSNLFGKFRTQAEAEAELRRRTLAAFADCGLTAECRWCSGTGTKHVTTCLGCNGTGRRVIRPEELL